MVMRWPELMAGVLTVREREKKASGFLEREGRMTEREEKKKKEKELLIPGQFEAKCLSFYVNSSPLIFCFFPPFSTPVFLFFVHRILLLFE